ncbi:MAG: DinB family protein [Thermoanaerobaculia bacterium]
MTNREFFIKRWEAEMPAFGKVLRAIPDNQLAYRPHEKSTAAGALAWQLAGSQRALVDLLKKGDAKWDTSAHPAKAGDIVAAWDKATEDLRKQLKSADDAKWSSMSKLTMGEGTAWSDSIENMFWGFLLDMIHHRGQLTVYLRPMGGKVPSIYGPSADDTGS